MRSSQLDIGSRDLAGIEDWLGGESKYVDGERFLTIGELLP